MLFGPLEDTSKTYYSPAHTEFMLVGKILVPTYVEGHYYHPLTGTGVLVVCFIVVAILATIGGFFWWLIS